jgi:SWI/SNF-related matrix-associated actin-dependent regulator 1 of chromatin subfamily A
MQVMSDFELHKLCVAYPKIHEFKLSESDWMDAGKVRKLMEILPNLQTNGDRVLLFSQFVIMLDILEVVLSTMGLNYIRLDGQTPLPERQELIDKYQNDDSIFIFLLSTKAGGFGINLTAANYVILYDIDFNPHNDSQVYIF